MSKKSRGRDVSIPSGTLPLNPTRLMGVSPLGVPFAATPVIYATPAGPAKILPNLSPIHATPTNRVATPTPRNDNLYRPPPITQKLSICQSRNLRREVVFATGKSGRNGMKTARYTPNSKVKCK